MTTYEDLQQANLSELTRPDCLRMLMLARVGRVGYVDDEGPVVLPVNFRMDGENILFRISPSSDMCRHLDGANVSFEIDQIDLFLQTGWSVLVRGTASYADSQDLPEHLSERPVPWARGTRPVYVRIRPMRITGRRLADA